MELTAIQMMITMMNNEMNTLNKRSSAHALLDATIQEAKKLIEYEKNQIAEAMMHALDEDGHTGHWKRIFIENYYSHTYKQKII